MSKLTPRQIINMIQNASSLELEIVWIPKFLQNVKEEDLFVVGVFEKLFVNDRYQKVKSGESLTPFDVRKIKDVLMNFAVKYSEMTI